MNVIIAGGRDFNDYELLKRKLNHLLGRWLHLPVQIDVVSGCAWGADRLGERWAKEVGAYVVPFPADWEKYGKAAGPIRNEEMAKYAAGEYCVCFWDGKSKGTKDMISLCQKYDINLRVVRY